MADSAPFEWLPEYGEILQQIASTDKVETEWTRLKVIIKHKLDENIKLLLSQSTDILAAPPLLTSPRHLPSGALKLPPFLPRPRDENNPNEAPKTVLTETDAQTIKESIFAQIDSLDGTPFTIQRLCELCLHPQKHYKFLGKYLRAVERSVLVTSTWETFPVSATAGTTQPIFAIAIPIGGLSTSAPPTPMFSPIPFLHDDARRSQSRSPPPSPLALTATDPNIAAIMPLAGSVSLEQKALGLVDELDDPSPGHLSDHPQPLSSTTSIAPKPVTSLQERFVRASEEPTEIQSAPIREGGEEMPVDDPEKENRAG